METFQTKQTERTAQFLGSQNFGLVYNYWLNTSKWT